MEVIPQSHPQRAIHQLFIAEFGSGASLSRISIDYQEVLGEEFALSNQFPSLVEYKAAPIEEQFVIPPDLVAKEDREASFHGDSAQHFEAGFIFTQMPGRCRDVEEHGSTCVGQLDRRIALVAALRPEIFVIPNILANGESKFAPAKIHRLIGRAGLEITVFIENIVGRQQCFVSGADNFSILKKSGAIGDFATRTHAVFADIPDQQSSWSSGGSKAVEHLEIL